MAFEIPAPLVSVFNKVTSTATGCGLIGWAAASIAMSLSYSCTAFTLAGNIRRYGIPTLTLGGLAYSHYYNQLDKISLCGTALAACYMGWTEYKKCTSINKQNPKGSPEHCTKDLSTHIEGFLLGTTYFSLIATAVSEAGQYIANSR
jgi:hypothetical protein